MGSEYASDSEYNEALNMPEVHRVGFRIYQNKAEYTWMCLAKLNNLVI